MVSFWEKNYEAGNIFHKKKQQANLFTKTDEN